MEVASQIGLKAKEICIKNTKIGINSLKTTSIWPFLILETAHGNHFWSVPSQFYIFWSPDQVPAWQRKSGLGAKIYSWSCFGIVLTRTESGACWAETVQGDSRERYLVLFGLIEQ